MINFDDVSPEDMATIGKIVTRARVMRLNLGMPGISVMTLMMDLTACHAKACPLQLNNLLAARDDDFAHDVFGIVRHINRETGEFGDNFTPRYALANLSLGAGISAMTLTPETDMGELYNFVADGIGEPRHK